jgi:ABC-type phosphate transport system auxiliary subunit
MGQLILPPRLRMARDQANALRLKKARLGLKKHATAKIQEHFPEHLFTVEVDEHGNLIIDHLLLADSKARYFCRYADYQDGKGVVKLAGEILERVNMHRSELKYYEDYDDTRVQALAKTQFKAK